MIQGVTDIAKAVESSGYGYVLKLGVIELVQNVDIDCHTEENGCD